MAEIVNLRQKRKQAARAAARKTADENAARSGQSKHERALIKARTDQAEHRLDGHQRDTRQHDGERPDGHRHTPPADPSA